MNEGVPKITLCLVSLVWHLQPQPGKSLAEALFTPKPAIFINPNQIERKIAPLYSFQIFQSSDRASKALFRLEPIAIGSLPTHPAKFQPNVDYKPQQVPKLPRSPHHTGLQPIEYFRLSIPDEVIDLVAQIPISTRLKRLPDVQKRQKETGFILNLEIDDGFILLQGARSESI